MKLSVAQPFFWKARLHVRFLFRGRNRITAVTRRASEPEGILPVVEFVQRRRRAESMHRLDFVVALETAFKRLSRALLLWRRCSAKNIHHEDTKAQREHKQDKQIAYRLICLRFLVSSW